MKIIAPHLASSLDRLTAPPLEAAITLENVEVAGIDWAGQESRRASFDSLRFVAPDITGTKLRDGGWADVEIDGGTLAGADFGGTTLRRVKIARARANGLVVAETEGKDITITESKLDLANFRFAKWQRVEFVRCSFIEADFAGAHLAEVSYRDCELNGCDFSSAVLQEVDLRSSKFEHLKGLSGLKGAIMAYDQLVALVPELAAELGIRLS